MSKKTITVLTALLVAVFLVGFALIIPHGFAFNGVFGGIMNVSTFCTCNGGHIISVGPPRPGRFYYVPGKSKLFEYGQITRSGVWVLGTYSVMTPCLQRVTIGGKKGGTACVPVPHQGNIEIVGTSR